MPPKVSIGLPVYNGAVHLRSALDALLGQTFTDFEIIICDNQSEDETRAICQEYAAKDSRIKYSPNETNIGAMNNFNRVWELATGEYFKWASHDDWISPRYLEKCVEALDSDPTATLAYGRLCMVEGRRNTKIQLQDIFPTVNSEKELSRFHDSIWHLQYYPIYGMFRTSVFEQTMKLTNNPEPDRILLAEVALRGPFVQVPYITLFQRASLRKNTWLWLNPNNKKIPFMNTFRSIKTLSGVVMGFNGLSALKKAAAVADILAWSIIRRTKGKLRQFRKNAGLEHRGDEQLDPDYVTQFVTGLVKEEAEAR